MGKNFEDLEVWKRACRIVVRLYDLLKESKDYGLKDQMLRAAVSVPSNIAEGSERGSTAEFKRFLNIANGSAAELRTQIYIAAKVYVLAPSETDTLIKELKEISMMLQGLIDSI